MDEFKVFGNQHRRSMLQILMKKESHIAQLARELHISNPVALKHVFILEQAGLVERERFGNSHVLRIKKESIKKIKQAFDLFDQSWIVEVPKGTRLLDALKKVSGLKVEKGPNGSFITQVDGKEGYFIFEVNGRWPEKPADEFKLEKDSEIELKQLLPVIGKKILVKMQ